MLKRARRLRSSVRIRPPQAVAFLKTAVESYPNSDEKDILRKLTANLIKLLLVVSLLSGLTYGAYWYYRQQSPTLDTALTFVANRRSITDTIIERGTLESQNTIVGSCDLPGFQNKIIFIVPEGTTVKQGDLVVRFDSDEIDRMVNEKSIALNDAEGKLAQAREDLDIQKNKSESDIAAAKLELSLAELDLKKYLEGDFLAERADFERSILEGEAELEKVNDELNNMRALVRKGFRSPEQLRELELRANSFQSRVDRDKQKMTVLVEFDFHRKKTEFEAKASEAKRKYERSLTTSQAEIRKAEANIRNTESNVATLTEEMKQLQDTKSKCEVHAPQAGTVAYANQPWFDPENRIREGATVYRQQNVFYLPDMSRMQIKVQIHESVINKIKAGQRAKIRIDAFPDATLDGTINFVSELAQSSFMDAKNYETVVLIDNIPETMNLKPGMTAKVEILVGTYDDVLAVPINAVTEHMGQSFVYVREDLLGARRQVVKTGRVTHAFVEITDGLDVGHTIFLDAYQRGLADFQQIEEEAATTPVPQPKPNPAEPGPETMPGATDELE